jgi:hypothetical protein
LDEGVADLRFDGWIAGVGSTSGVRVVVGCWPDSPYGPVADVMLELPDGHRMLLAPTAELAEFVSATYTFDEVCVVPVRVEPPGLEPGGRVRVVAGELDVTLDVGRPTWLGRLLRLVPRRLAGQLWWVSLIDRPARLMVPGVRTVGSAVGGRREFYAARDNRALALVAGSWRGADLGRLADVVPAVRFGFASTPPRPSWTRITTTVRVPG